MLSKLKPKQIEAVSIEIARLGPGGGHRAGIGDLRVRRCRTPIRCSAAVAVWIWPSPWCNAPWARTPATRWTRCSSRSKSLPFGFLKKVDPQNVVTFINDEHPQTIALILSHLPPAYGAQIIAGLTPERQMAVIQRIAHMGQTNPEVIKQVEEGLESRMMSVMSQQFENAGGVSSVAEILNVTDRATERNLLENLAQEDPELVDEIRRLMFVFEDINKLRDKDVQTVLKNVESAQWAMALKGASEELKQKILGNMSQRAAQLLQEEMEYLGAVRLSEVEAVQQQIVDIIRRLEDAGEISTHTEEENEEMIQ